MVTSDQAIAVAHIQAREVNGLSFVLDVTLLPSVLVLTELALTQRCHPSATGSRSWASRPWLARRRFMGALTGFILRLIRSA